MELYDNIYEYFCDNRFSIILNFLSTIVGAFLGFVFAIIIYWIGNWQIRKNKELAEKEKAYNILKRFSLLIQSVITTCKKQNESFKKHANDLIRKPLYFHLPQILTTNDRDRLIKSDNIELYKSFMLFDKLNENKFEDYKKTFNHADFIHRKYEDLLSQSEKHQNFIHSDLKNIRDNLLAISIRMALMQKDIQIEMPQVYKDNVEYKFIEKYKTIYIGLQREGFTDLETYRDNFLIPLQTELFENISNQNQANEIASHIANALTLMENVIENVKNHASNFANIDDEHINSALDYLEKVDEKIKKIKKP
jgi:prepilin signal peptidase PulO-like enzyme (type II secretory pathway)